MTLRRHTACLLLISNVLCAYSKPTKDRSTGKFLWISDPHYDPYYGTPQAVSADEGCGQNASVTHPFGRLGCDSPFALIENSLKAASKQLARPDFIILTGDYVRHDSDLLPNPVQDVLHIFRNITDLLVTTFPSVPRIHLPPAVLGNNDFDSDYDLPNVTEGITLERNPWLSDVATAYSQLLSPAESDTYRRGGYYSREVVPGVHVLLLNTVVYSPRHTPNTSALADPFGQFAWLDATLQAVQARGGSAYVVGHIPPILDTYQGAAQWEPAYVHRYLQTLARHADVVAGQLYGHLHVNTFRVMPAYSPFDSSYDKTTWRAPLMLNAAITPIYFNNPTFRIVDYDRATGSILDYAQYITNITAGATPPVWVPQFKSALAYLGTPSLSNADVDTLAKSYMTGDTQRWEAFLAQLASGNPPSVHTAISPSGQCTEEKCRQTEVCIMLAWSEEDVSVCTDSLTWR